MDDQTLLTLASRKASRRRFFVAHALASSKRAKGLDDAGLAHEFGLALVDLPRLALRRMPEPETPRFEADLVRVADHAGVEREILRRVLAEASEYARSNGPPTGVHRVPGPGSRTT